MEHVSSMMRVLRRERHYGLPVLLPMAQPNCSDEPKQLTGCGTYLGRPGTRPVTQ